MFSAKQLRTKAAESAEAPKSTDVPSEIRGLQRSKQSFSDVAQNETWLTDNFDKMIRSRAEDERAGKRLEENAVAHAAKARLPAFGKTIKKRRTLSTAPPVPYQKKTSIVHKFKIGQIVELEPSVLRPSPPGGYEIRHLAPASDKDPGNPCYRIKNAAEKHERVASENTLTLSMCVFA